MATAEWTYEVPAFGSDAVWLEEYLVHDAKGSRIGRVLDVVERDGQLWLAVELADRPLRHHRHAVPFDHVDAIDHDAATIRLRDTAEQLEQATPELDPHKAVEEGEADARRVTDPPRELVPPRAPPRPGPQDTPGLYAVAPLLVRLSGIALLGVGIYASFRPQATTAAWLAVPAAILVLAAVALWRSWQIRWRPPPR